MARTLYKIAGRHETEIGPIIWYPSCWWEKKQKITKTLPSYLFELCHLAFYVAVKRQRTKIMGSVDQRRSFCTVSKTSLFLGSAASERLNERVSH